MSSSLFRAHAFCSLALLALPAWGAGLEFRGIAVHDQGSEFSLHNLATGESAWLKTGQSWGATTVLAYDAQSHTLTLKDGGNVTRLTLPEEIIATLNASAGSSAAGAATPVVNEARLMAKAEAWARTMEPDPVRMLGRRARGFTPIRAYAGGSTRGPGRAIDSQPQAAPADNHTTPVTEDALVENADGATTNPPPDITIPRPPDSEDRIQVTPRRITAKG